MTDSPFQRMPLDPKEQPILDRVLYIRDKLQILKQDRSTYIKSQDVMGLYDAVIEQVEVLNQIRQTKPDEQNRGRIVATWMDELFADLPQWTPYWTTVSS